MVMSEKTKQLISKKLKGIKRGKMSDEHKLKISLSKIGHKTSPETRKKMSLSHIGEKNGFYGKKHTTETKENMRKTIINTLSNGRMVNKNTLPERIVEECLNLLHLEYEKQWKYELGVADFYVPEHNLVIEAYGNYWHNLESYRKRDALQQKWLKENNYKILILWEKELKNDIKKCERKLKEMLKNGKIKYNTYDITNYKRILDSGTKN